MELFIGFLNQSIYEFKKEKVIVLSEKNSFYKYFLTYWFFEKSIN